MRLIAPAAAILLAGLTPHFAAAQTTVIERDRPDVVVDRPATESKTVVRRDDGDGCSSKTVTKTNELGDRKTVHKESCD
ncbi:hypothetical protein ACFQE0_09540 [Methylobacterium komagatae]|uniref:Secreted protein n=1 Tax=Methylobacterium komagatae TaxID=374425 RepID=A0ABW2BJ19_9HYPH